MVYAGGHESGYSVIYRTNDGGLNWSKLAVSGLTGYVYDLVVDPFAPHIIFAATHSGVFISFNFGDTWTQCDPGIGGTQALLLTYPTDYFPTIYAGTENNGVWYSTDGGNNWYEMNTGLDDDYVGCLTIDDGNYLLAGTDAYAAYRWNILTGTAENSSLHLDRFAFNVTPNPAFGSMSINYSLSAPAEVEIDVYDLQGRLVATVFEGPRQSGSHNELWQATDDNGNGLAGGIYFCRLTTAGYTQSKKIILIGAE